MNIDLCGLNPGIVVCEWGLFISRLYFFIYNILATSTSTVEDIDELYYYLVVAYKHCKSQDMIIMMGDLNAKVGKEQDPLNVTVGPHGLGERNERGDL